MPSFIISFTYLVGFIATSTCAFQLLPALHHTKRIPYPSSPLHATTSSNTVATVEKTDEEWKESLNREQFNVLRREGTEPAWTSPLNDVKEDGTFCCAGCGAPLYVTSTKYESRSGWPSFYDPIDENAINLTVDYKLVIPRTEVTCKSCGGHLGHVFDDGPQPTGKRYCMNGVAMDFVSDEENPDLSKSVLERTMRKTGGIKEPLMTSLPSIAFNAALGFFFIASFISKNGNDGLSLFSEGFTGVGQIFQLFPLFFGAYYAASALRKAVDLIFSSE